MQDLPESRLRNLNDAAPNGHGQYVLYWMIAQRRVRWNFALERAAAWARELRKPLLVFEALRCDYRWASDRLHRFILQGMADNAHRLAATRATYFPFVERRTGQGRGLLAALARHACAVVTDDFPAFFLPRMVSAATEQVPVRFEQIDSNGLLPLRAADKVFSRAVDFRRFLQRRLPPHLVEPPAANPLAGTRLPRLEELPAAITRRWRPAGADILAAQPRALAKLPIDHSVAPVTEVAGGSSAAEDLLDDFVDHRLDRYGDDRNALVDRATSGLSPYLHFGHLAAHQVFAAVAEHEGWNPGRLADRANGSRVGWWGMSASAEAFLDQLVTWRELGYNMAAQRDDLDRYESLPDWARATLEDHLDDPRPQLYSLDELENARTHDEVWNAAQRELVRGGRIHNYLRMLWGKKILEWSAHPRKALAAMIELNNKYALDGRNPNSYSGIFWCLGRYDRAWGPERAIFGKVRYMSSENTRRKLPLGPYLEEFGPAASS